MIQELEIRSYYGFTCPGCNHEQIAIPSVFMRLGLNKAHAKCLVCGAFLNLAVSSDGQKMDAVAGENPWAEGRRFGESPSKECTFHFGASDTAAPSTGGKA